MKIKLIIISLFFTLDVATTVKAQALSEFLDMAIQNNLELKVLENEYRAAIERAPQVSQLPDPEIGIGVFPLPVETRLGAQSARLSAMQMFPWFGTLDVRKNIELTKAEALYKRVAARTLDLSYEVKIAFFQLYEIRETQAIIQRNLEIFQSLERLVLTKVESGKATAADVLSVQLKIEELKQELDILETAKVGPTASINQLLNRKMKDSIVISDKLTPAEISFDRDSILPLIRSGHPIVQMFELQQDISRQAISLNKLTGKPSFGLGMDYINVSERDDAFPVGNGRDIFQLKASINIPLYRQKYAAKEREENQKIEALDHRKTDVLTRFSSMIEKAYADYETAYMRISLYEKQLEITKAAIQILETNYSTQGSSFDELLRLEKELIDYDLKLLKATVQSHIAKSRIERFIPL